MKNLQKQADWVAIGTAVAAEATVGPLREEVGGAEVLVEAVLEEDIVPVLVRPPTPVPSPALALPG